MSLPGFSRRRLQALAGNPRVVLRHDVDYDTGCALQMARFEADLGIYSTYYARTLESYDNRKKARIDLMEISVYGHDVAVHADLQLPRQARVSTDKMVAAAEHTYDSLAGELPVTRKVSFHAPPHNIYWRHVPGFIHALEPIWSGRYLADSRGSFRTEPEQFILTQPTVQLNLHPEWWWLPLRQAVALQAREKVRP
jgi:hypothetical protein